MGAFDHLAQAALDLGIAKARSEAHLKVTLGILRRFVADHSAGDRDCDCTLCKDARVALKEYEAKSK